MKINKYTPPDSLKAEVMSKITDDGYADELLSLPKTRKKKTRIIPLLSAAAVFTLVVCASVYVIGLDGVKKSEDEENSFSGSTDQIGSSDAIEGDGSTADTDAPQYSSGSNDNSFTPEDDSLSDTDENGSSKGNSEKNNAIILTVTADEKTVTLSPSDSVEVLELINSGKPVDVDCKNCSTRYVIGFENVQYVIHSECGNIVRDSVILGGVSIPALDEIVKKYIDIE